MYLLIKPVTLYKRVLPIRKGPGVKSKAWLVPPAASLDWNTSIATCSTASSTAAMPSYCDKSFSAAIPLGITW
jgi:hypothetical protein